MFNFVIFATLLVSTLAGVPRTLPIRMDLSMSSRVINGENANIEEVPYQVFIFTSKILCGGSIIRPDAVLSAAHCTQGPVSSYSFHAGSNHHSIGGQLLRAHNIKNHEKFSHGPSLDYDISIIKLSASFRLGTSVAVIRLPAQNQPVYAASWGITSGWGTIQAGVLLVPEILQKVLIPVVDQETCRAIYGVSTRMFCAGSYGKGHCSGDSGGPFVIDGEIMGVVSGASIECTLQGPGLYTRVPFFVDWINSNYNAMK